MTRRTIDNVAPDVREWQSKYGDIMYSVTAFTTTREVISANKKDRNAAFELQGLLAEIVGTPQEFILEDKGVSDSGWQKYNLKAFGPPEGVWTYSTIKGGTPDVAGAPERTQVHSEGRPAPGPSPSAYNVDASIRASVALKAAASAISDGTVDDVLRIAEVFDEWLAKKSSGDREPLDQDGVEGSGEGPSTSSKTTWQERVKDWPDPSENPL